MARLTRAFVCVAAISTLCVSAAVAQVSLPVDDRTALREFLQAMPKGGDLHNHLSGAVYAESYLRYAAEDGLCIDRQKLSIAPCATPAQIESNLPGTPASTVFSDPGLYSAMLDSLSMRQFRPATESGHDRFFSTFGKFSVVSRAHAPEMLTEDVWRLATENVDYLETIFAPDTGKARELGRLAKPDQPYAEMRAAILASGQVQPLLTAARSILDRSDEHRRKTLRCGEPSTQQAGCASTVRYLYELHRGYPLPQFFAELTFGYELAVADSRVVGLNPVMPEDGYVSMRDFDAQMKMFAFFRQLYPKIHVSMHAGELAPGLVEPEGLRHHIRDSVLVGGAERIGHGVDLAYEEDATGLLNVMADRAVAVEICLTSNDVILGISGRAHPLRTYLAAGVPVALATDDPGVSRDDMTTQYMRAVQDQGLDYPTLKGLARNSLEYSFVEGDSLWVAHDYGKRASACGADSPPSVPSQPCALFLQTNTKARIEWRLEQRLLAFESTWK